VHRPHEHGLQEAALGVAADRPERQEHREDRAQEQRGEHGQAEDRRARDRARLHPVDRLVELAHRVEQLPAPEPVQREEREREQADHEEDAPAQRLPQREHGDDARTAHSSPTASRYASSSEERSRRTP
jgi:hypothetical protein